jgi:hypothetical protein
MKAQEKKEDDTVAAVEDLKAVEKGKKRILYIGVTCGLRYKWKRNEEVSN